MLGEAILAIVVIASLEEARDDLVRCLRARETAGDAFKSRFVVDDWELREGYDPRSNEPRPGVVSTGTFVFMHAEGQYRIESISESDGMPQLIWRWDGRTWSVFRANENAMTIASKPRLPMELDCVFHFNGSCGPSLVGRLPLSAVAEAPIQEAPEVREDAEIWKFELGSGKTEVTLAVRPENRADVLWLRMEARAERGGPVQAWWEYRVMEWGSYDGLALPSIIERTSSISTPEYPHRAESGEVVSRIIYRRLDVSQPSSAELGELESLTCVEGRSVSDSRTNAVYRCGDTSIKLGGYRFDAGAPLDPKVILHLERYALAPLRSIEGTAKGTALAAVGTQVLRKRFQIGAGLVGITICGMIMLVWHSRPQARQKASVWAAASVVAVLATWWWQTRGADPSVEAAQSVANVDDRVLSGRSDFDFGRIPFVRPKTEVSHTFSLTNDTGKRLSVVKSSASCGCTRPSVSKDVIEPGECLDVVVALSFVEPSQRRESAWLVFDDGSIHRLQIAGAAVASSRSWAAQQAVPLDSTGQEDVLLSLSDQTGTVVPAEPSVHLPENVSASFGGWNEIYGADRTIGRPARWHGTLTLKSYQNIPFRSKAKITFSDTSEAIIDLTGWPWDG
jgi:hypothetical protein